MGADVVKIADSAHGGCDHAFARDSESGDAEDAAPASEGTGVGEDQRPAPESMMTSCGCSEGCSVSDGPFATNPTAQTIRKMPAQRYALRYSCSQKRLSSATTT